MRRLTTEKPKEKKERKKEGERGKKVIAGIRIKFQKSSFRKIFIVSIEEVN